jgi:hypothetical protein
LYRPLSPGCKGVARLRILRDAGLVEGRPDPQDSRARVYDIRREHLIQLHAWIHQLEEYWRDRTRLIATDPDYYKGHRLDPNVTTRGTPRIRNLRRLLPAKRTRAPEPARRGGVSRTCACATREVREHRDSHACGRSATRRSRRS